MSGGMWIPNLTLPMMPPGVCLGGTSLPHVYIKFMLVLQTSLLEDTELWPAGPCEFPGLLNEFAILQNPVTCMNKELDQSILDLFCTYSSWQRLRSSVAGILRLKSKLRHKPASTGLYSFDELEAESHTFCSSTFCLLKGDSFPTLLELSKSNFLRKLHLILLQCLLRVGGHLKNVDKEFDVKHPIILSSSYHVMQLLIEDHHLEMGHTGMVITWTSLRQNY